MKAAINERYGPADVVQIKDVAKPVPKPNEVLVKIVATTVTIGDTIMRSLNLPLPGWQKILARLYLGFYKPKRKTLGMEFAGVIEEIGSKVTKYKVGDEVFASTFSENFGAHAEYKCMKESGVLGIKPENISFGEAAAAIGGGLTALRVIQKGKIQKGQKVLINGASGAVGTFGVQLAKHFGAEITGVCSGANFELVKSLGATKVIDYTKEDFTQSDEKYDIVFDAVGKIPKHKRKLALNNSGKFLNVMTDSSGGENLEALSLLHDLLEKGAIKTVIDRTYPFEEIVEAHRYVETWRKKGNVVIEIVHK